MVLRVATRGSKLALWQTRRVVELLDVEVEIVVVETEGDRTQAAAVPIEAIGGRGVFVKEVQAAVLDGRADFAVHSAKDLPAETLPDLVIAAVPERGDPRDALIGNSVESLPVGGLVATGSVRRRAQLAAIRPDLTFVGLRGNVDTRFSRVEQHDAVVMAYAPIQRLGFDETRVHVLDPDVMLPQVGQGALAVECRADAPETIEMLRRIEHRSSRAAVDAERAFLGRLGGGCDLPVGAYARHFDGQIEIEGLIASLDGRIVLRRRATGADPRSVGQACARALLVDDGAGSLLAGFHPDDDVEAIADE